MKFELRSGDGNFGTAFDEYIYARDMDHAVEQAAMIYGLERDMYGDYIHIKSGVSIMEDGDDMTTYLTASEGPNGEAAYNGGSWWYAEVVALEL